MLANCKANTNLPLKTQLEVDQKEDQNIPTSHKHVYLLKTLKGLHPSARYDAEHLKNEWDDDVVINKHSKTSHKKNKEEFHEDA
jgi:hypothetical protein